MSGPDRNDSSPDDRLLREFLAGDSAVSKAYRAAPASTTPAALDDVVLKIARDEAGRPAIVATRRNPWRRLRLPVAAAATLMLSMSFLLSVQRDDETRRMVFDMALPPVALPPRLEEARPRAPAAEVDRAEPAKPQIYADAEALEPPPPPRAPPSVAALAKKKAEQPDVSAMTAAPAAARSEASPAAAQAAETPAEPQVREERRMHRSAETPERFKGRQSTFNSSAPALATAPAIAEREAVAPPPSIEAPLPWLDRIRALRDGKKMQEARTELAAFRRAYPEHPLPEDLRPLTLAY